MKLIICGPHRSGKTTELTEILLNTNKFILIDTTYEEHNKSILSKYEKFFDLIIHEDNLEKLLDLDKEYERIGVNLSSSLERFFESNNINFLRLHINNIKKTFNFLSSNPNIEDYLIAMDEVYLNPSYLKKDVDDLKEVVYIPPEDYYCKRLEQFFDKKNNKVKNL